ncbi:hypothetical protein PG984_002582 [Apiospora sp. TS-2023a]
MTKHERQGKRAAQPELCGIFPKVLKAKFQHRCWFGEGSDSGGGNLGSGGGGGGTARCLVVLGLGGGLGQSLEGGGSGSGGDLARDRGVSFRGLLILSGSSGAGGGAQGLLVYQEGDPQPHQRTAGIASA